MDGQDGNEKSFGPKLFDGNPARDWGIDRLCEYANEENDAIDEGERSLTPHYWRLGAALELLRKEFSRGQWAPFLADLQVSKARASKARAIHRTFRSVDQVRALTVEAAYERRKRRSRSSTTGQCSSRRAPSGGQDLPALLHQVGMKTDGQRDEVDQLPQDVAAELLTQVEQVIADLSCLRDRLRERTSAI